MKLEAFRVQNFKKVRDTGWVSCRDLTVFVGKNESGKSAVFRGLSKLNPSDGEKYDGLKEFPRRRYTDEFAKQDWPVSSARFSLTDEEQDELAEICPEISDAGEVVCTRHYSWKLTVGFEPAMTIKALSRRAFATGLEKLADSVRSLGAPDGKGEALADIKATLLNDIQARMQAQQAADQKEVVPKTEVDQLQNGIAGQANEDWQQTALQPIVDAAAELAERASASTRSAAAGKWVAENLPKFIYFDRYDVIDSAVHLPTFAQQLASTPTAPKIRTTRCLFEHVGLDIEKLASLGRHQPNQGPADDMRRLIDERAIHFSSASNAMTVKFADWWEQRKHRFRYQADGDYFRIWVSDDLDPSEIELDQRSQGMQYFFSFFVVFLVEAEGAHQDNILLLDEPGLHMHGTAQAMLVEFFEKIARDNQTLYSTHSPFMVDMDHLERTRVVHEQDDGTTCVSEDVWPRDKDALFPLQAGLGYQLVQSLFISKRQLIVEGLTDMWIISAVNEALKSNGSASLRDDIVVVPSAGVTKLLPLASMLVGHDVEIAALIDGDEPGRRAGKKLVDKLLQGNSGQCFFLGDFLPDAPHAELEDLFPEEDYLTAVKEAYSPKGGIKFNKDEKELPGVVDRVEAYFKRKDLGPFHKWKPAAILRDRILEDGKHLPEQTREVMAKIMAAVNGAFSGPDVS